MHESTLFLISLSIVHTPVSHTRLQLKSAVPKSRSPTMNKCELVSVSVKAADAARALVTWSGDGRVRIQGSGRGKKVGGWSGVRESEWVRVKVRGVFG